MCLENYQVEGGRLSTPTILVVIPYFIGFKKLTFTFAKVNCQIVFYVCMYECVCAIINLFANVLLRFSEDTVVFANYIILVQFIAFNMHNFTR